MLLSSSVPALAIGQMWVDLGNSNYPANQLLAGSAFRRLVRSLSLRPSCLLAPRADQTCGTPSFRGLPGPLLPGFQVTGSPQMPAGYNYDAKLRTASAGLSPVESMSGAPAVGGRSGRLLAAFATCQCLILHHRHVSTHRSPNRTCGFPAFGSPVGSCASHTDKSVVLRQSS